MRNTAREEILNYWNGLRGSRAAPLRSDFDPAAMRHFLPHLFILTAAAPGAPTFALAGTQICDLFDRELRGTDYACVWTGTAAEEPSEIVDHVLFYERPALLDVRLSPLGDDYPYDMLLMPLRSPENRSDRVLGALTPRVAAVPPLLRPIDALSLENWAFAGTDGAMPSLDKQLSVETVAPANLFRRLVGGRFVPVGR
jgi:hypothetical protein